MSQKYDYMVGKVAQMWNDGTFREVVDDPQSPKNMGSVGWRLVSTFVQDMKKGKRNATDPDAIAWAVYERDRGDR